MAKNTISGEQAALRTLYNENEYAAAILDDFASRSNNQKVTKVDQIIKRVSSVDLPRWAVIKLFKGLGAHGHGRFVEGRHGHPSRFIWSSSSIEVARNAKGETVAITQVQPDDAEEEEESGLRTHQFNLRTDLVITFDLPPDLTEKEAERLAGFLRTLPI